MFSWSWRTNLLKENLADFISGHFMKIWILVIFSIFFHLFQHLLISDNVTKQQLLWPWNSFTSDYLLHKNLYLNHFGPIEPEIEAPTFWPVWKKRLDSSKNRPQPLKVFSVIVNCKSNCWTKKGGAGGNKCSKFSCKKQKK